MNQNKQTATELFIIQPEDGARSPQRASKAIRKDRKIPELKECFDTKKISLGNMHKEYLYTLMCKYCSNVVLLLYYIFNTFKTLHKAVFLRVGETPLFGLK